jgi:methyl farnesoate epoxidase/farnesoate epoxidase
LLWPPEVFKKDEASQRPPVQPNNENRPGWHTMDGENEGRLPGVLGSGGQYWKEIRRFMLRNLKDFGFGKSSMESMIQDELAKLCSKLKQTPEVKMFIKIWSKVYQN